jgi:hypothetical protein
MDSAKDIKITSESKITIEGIGGVAIPSSADAQISGLNINLNANAGLKAQGDATAELSAGDEAKVK